jgi:hemerythrin-like domain-containing protein
MRTSNPADPINILYAEHDEALAQLDALQKAARALATEGALDTHLTALERAVMFLDREIRVHNQWEEDHLFPKLEAAMGPGGPCLVMRAEHRQLWDMYGTLNPLLKEAREGRAGADGLRSLASVAEAIVSLLGDHIEKENHILFPMARQVLGDVEMSELTAERTMA